MIDETDLGLSDSEVQELVTGAQRFLPPAADPRDEEKLSERATEPTTPFYGTDY